MKHVIRILYRTLVVTIGYVIGIIAVMLVNLCQLIWYGNIKHCNLKNDIKDLLVEELPDGTRIYGIIDDGSLNCTYTGMNATYKYIYYKTWINAIKGIKEEKIFSIEVKER